jgi:tetratricopeptide (TPR) repeat protein
MTPFRKIAALVLVACAMAGPLAAAARADAPTDELDRRIARLIEQLGAGEYATRRRALDELAKIGFDAFDALCDAQNSDDPEIAMQAGYLVRRIRGEAIAQDDPRLQQILKEYERQPDARRLKQMAELPVEAGLELLCRLARFEESPTLSKEAALAIIAQPPPADAAAWTARAALIAKHTARSRRPAAHWLATYLKAHDDPAGALASWSALADAERRTLDEQPQETSSRIVTALLRHKIVLLDRLGRASEVPDVLRQMVLAERGEAASLGELVDWLAKRKAWNVIDEVAERFAASFELDAMLLYTLCEARLAQGNQALADETAKRALKLGGDNALEHLLLVERLLERGMTEWSDRELRHVIALGPVASPAGINARLILADSLHDRQRDGDAADVIKGLVDAADADRNVMQQLKLLLQQPPRQKSVDFLRARLLFYSACDAVRQKNSALARELLEKAIAEEPADLDVLIALHRLDDNDADRRARLSKLIRNVVEQCRAKIEDEPDEPVNYNDLAWLVANTEGDLDDALRLSHKSIELVRAEATSEADFKQLGQYLDTLAHCYFAKKDYESAVKYQTEAVRLDPHTKAISRQLEVFRAALAKARGK